MAHWRYRVVIRRNIDKWWYKDGTSKVGEFEYLDKTKEVLRKQK